MIKIYCIECIETGEKYIGSTKQKLLSSRIADHKHKKSCRSRYIIKRGNWKYYLLEEVEVSQRLIREQYYMDTTDKCINKNRAIGYTQKEYLEVNKDRFKQYRKVYDQLNKDKIKEYHKQLNNYKNTWGGDSRSNNNLLQISLDLFN